MPHGTAEAPRPEAADSAIRLNALRLNILDFRGMRRPSTIRNERPTCPVIDVEPAFDPICGQIVYGEPRRSPLWLRVLVVGAVTVIALWPSD